MTNPKPLFTAEDFLTLFGPGQGGLTVDIYAKLKPEAAAIVALNANAKAAPLQAEVEALRQQNENFIKTVGQDTKRIKELQAELSEIRAGFRTVKEQNLALQAELERLRAENERLRTNYRQDSEMLDEAAREIERLQDKAQGANKLALEFAADNARLREALESIAALAFRRGQTMNLDNVSFRLERANDIARAALKGETK